MLILRLLSWCYCKCLRTYQSYLQYSVNFFILLQKITKVNITGALAKDHTDQINTTSSIVDRSILESDKISFWQTWMSVFCGFLCMCQAYWRCLILQSAFLLLFYHKLKRIIFCKLYVRTITSDLVDVVIVLSFGTSPNDFKSWLFESAKQDCSSWCPSFWL